ncbi:MAG: hypothetical protein ACYTAN_16115 [Planctomycetota bacterium]|jgi:hypothetical protein
MKNGICPYYHSGGKPKWVGKIRFPDVSVIGERAFDYREKGKAPGEE